MSWKLREKARKLLAAERGTVFKSPGGKVTVALIYPNTYHVGMSNLGFLSLYHYLNVHPFILCERTFLPDPEDLPEYLRTRTPLFSLESGRPLSSFDVLAFSLSYENDYPNLLQILELAGVPLRSEERGLNCPLVMAGGICAFSNPEPLAQFVDLFFLGEGEEAFPKVLQLLWQMKGKGEGRGDFLRESTRIEGVYVPHFFSFSFDQRGEIKAVEAADEAFQPPRRHFLDDLDSHPVSNFIETPNTELGGMRLLEIQRGCKRNCRFCLVGRIYSPFRFRSPEVLLQELEMGGLRRVGLVGPCISDHPQINDFCSELLTRGYSISASSLRPQSLSPHLLDCLVQSGQRTVTLAPEAASERLRSLLGKDMRDDDLYAAVEEIYRRGISNIRLYFMIGLPSEQEEEVEAIAQVAKKIKHMLLVSSRERRPLGQITLSISSFVPKPWTPFQWLEFEETGRLQQKLGLIKRSLKGAGNIHCLHDLPTWAYKQALLSRGDRRVGELLLMVHELKGNWRRAFREWNLNPDFFVHRRRSRDEILPWDHLATGPNKGCLGAELDRAGLG